MGKDPRYDHLDLSKRVWFNRRGLDINQTRDFLTELKVFKYRGRPNDEVLHEMRFTSDYIYPSAMPLTHAWEICGASKKEAFARDESLQEYPFTRFPNPTRWFKADLVYIDEIKELYFAGLHYRDGSWHRSESCAEARIKLAEGHR